MSGTQQAFVTTYLPYAQQASADTGLPVDYILAQAALESGWGTSNAAVTGNNFFGISPGGSLASYSNPAAGFSAFSNLLNSPRYAGVAAAVPGGALAIGNAEQAAGYNPDAGYGASVAALVPQIDAMLGAGNGGVAGGTGGAGGSGMAATPSGASGAAGSGSGNGGVVATVESYLGRVGFTLAGLVMLAGGIYLFGRRNE